MNKIWIVDVFNNMVIEGIRSDINAKQNYWDSLGLIELTKQDAEAKLKNIKMLLRLI